MNTCILIPAYGRKYLGRDSVLKDWNAGKDFQILGGPYCSIRDIALLKREYLRGVIVYSRSLDAVVWETWKEVP